MVFQQIKRVLLLLAAELSVVITIVILLFPPHSTLNYKSARASQRYKNLLDEVGINCKDLLKRNEDAIEKAKKWTYDINKIEKKIRVAKDRCFAIRKLFGFDRKNITEEERQYPLAYGAIVYKNFVQVMFMLSAFYRAHNEYCIAVSGSASRYFVQSMIDIGKCFKNVHILQRPPIRWASFEIINTVWTCVETLSKSKTKWMYYQQLAGVDIPLKTNFEMVSILKKWNNTVNIDFGWYTRGYLRGKKMSDSPLPIIRSSMSGAIPRKAIERIIEANKARELLSFLNGTQVPDEAFWATITSNTKIFPVPGATDGHEWIKYRANYRKNYTDYVARYEEADPSEALMNYYLARYQIWHKKWCKGKMRRYSCLFGLDDIADVIKQPHLIAHKFHLTFQPAAFLCIIKEIRAREAKPLNLNLTLYAEIPQVELSAGLSYDQLSHRIWMVNKHWIGN